MEQSGRDFRDAIQSVREIVGRQPETVPRRKVATYTYTDEKGAPLFRVFRYFPKGFSQARVTGNGASQPRLGDVRRVLYRLPEVLEADRVYICEGEKDADLLNRWQLVGTTNSGGTGKWRSEYAETLRGKSVAIIPDADEPGRRHALSVAASLLGMAESVKVIELPRANDLSGWAETGGDAEGLRALERDAEPLTGDLLSGLADRWFPDNDNQAKPGRAVTAPLAAEQELEDGQWPKPMARAAFHGLAGAFIREAAPNTEADAAAMLVQFLTGFGSIIGRGAHFMVRRDRHGANLFALIVGTTSQGRKGVGFNEVAQLLRAADAEWGGNCIEPGLSSGEGLIERVRDANPADDDDQGVTDKRLLIVETEFGRTLRVARREGSILSTVLRQVWDGGDLGILTRNAPLRATAPHVSLIGHITPSELRKYLTADDISCGLANRLLIACSRRSKYLADGGTQWDWTAVLEGLREAVAFARQVEEVRRGPAAAELWGKVYRTLADGSAGLLGEATARGAAMVVRLSMLFALLALSDVVRVEHLEAALAVWNYSERSMKFILGTATGEAGADRILAELRAREGGMSRTEVSALFGRNKSSAEITRLLQVLAGAGLVRCRRTPTKGPPAETWFVSSTNYEIDETTPLRGG